MHEKEKRKPLPTWYRPVGLAILFVSLALCCLAPLLLARGISPRVFVPLTLVLAVFAGIGGALYMWPSVQGHPTLNQIRQNPDNPLIVQQWNGRAWVDTLDMRSAVKDAQDSDDSLY